MIIMATQLVPTPIIKGDKILEVIKEIKESDYGDSYEENISNLKQKYKEYIDNDETQSRNSI